MAAPKKVRIEYVITVTEGATVTRLEGEARRMNFDPLRQEVMDVTNSEHGLLGQQITNVIRGGRIELTDVVSADVERRPRTDAEALARAVLDGDEAAALLLADLVLDRFHAARARAVSPVQA